VQGSNGAPSNEHSKVRPSAAVKLNCAVLLVVNPDGPLEEVNAGCTTTKSAVRAAPTAARTCHWGRGGAKGAGWGSPDYLDVTHEEARAAVVLAATLVD